MTSPRIYAVVPRTLYDRRGNNITMSCGRMAAQVAHLAGRLGNRSIDVAGIDTIVLQVPNTNDMEKVLGALFQSSIDHEEYLDTNKAYDGELLTAVMLYPIERGSCAALRELKPWVCACNI